MNDQGYCRNGESGPLGEDANLFYDTNHEHGQEPEGQDDCTGDFDSPTTDPAAPSPDCRQKKSADAEIDRPLIRLRQFNEVLRKVGFEESVDSGL